MPERAGVAEEEADLESFLFVVALRTNASIGAELLVARANEAPFRVLKPALSIRARARARAIDVKNYVAIKMP